MEHSFELEPHHVRSAIVLRKDPKDDDDRSIELSFSSEAEVERWWGVEVLGHGDGEADFSRLNTGRSPLLKDHRNSVDAKVGTVSRAWIDGDKGRAIVEFSRTDEGDTMLDRVRSGDLTEISVGYEIRNLVLQEERKDAPNVYRATDWSPHEISLVAAPADPSIGIGRSAGDQPRRTFTFKTEKGADMPKDTVTPVPGADDATRTADLDKREAAVAAREAEIAERQSEDDKKAAEAQRVTDIRLFGAQFNVPRSMIDDACAKSNVTIERFRGLVADHLGDAAGEDMGRSHIGLTGNEIDGFSIRRLMLAMINPLDARLQEDAAFELDACAAAGKKRETAGKGGFSLPAELAGARTFEGRPIELRGQRIQQAGVAADGGITIETNIAGMIEYLRNTSVFWGRAQPLRDLVGNIDYPRQLTSGAAAWLAENAAAADMSPTWGEVQLRPHDIGGRTQLTRRILMQSSFDIEMLARQNILDTIALQVDLAAAYGAGGDEPLGVANTVGIGAVPFAAATPTRAEIIALEGPVKTGNAFRGSLFYACNGAMDGVLQTVPVDAGSGLFVMQNDRINSREAAISEQIAAGDVFFGNGYDAFAAGWGDIEVLVDPYTDADKGGVNINAFMTADYAVRHAASWSLGQTP